MKRAAEDDVKIEDIDEDNQRANDSGAPPLKKARRTCPYLDTINRNLLDFDFEKVCSVSLTNLNVYACLVCGKYFQGRGRGSHAYIHSLEVNHHVYIHLFTNKIYCLPDDYEVVESSLDDIKVRVIFFSNFFFNFLSIILCESCSAKLKAFRTVPLLANIRLPLARVEYDVYQRGNCAARQTTADWPHAGWTRVGSRSDRTESNGYWAGYTQRLLQRRVPSARSRTTSARLLLVARELSGTRQPIIIRHHCVMR